MAMDLTVAGYDTWDDLLVYMDGSAAVIGEMMLPILEPLVAAARAAGPRPRPGLPAHELPARRRRGPRPRPGLPARRRTSTASAPTRGAGTVDDAVARR